MATDPETGEPRRGRLKVFLGAAAGVGKTTAMLRDALLRQAAGARVAAGFVETHGQPEVAALLEGLEVVARRRVPGPGAVLEDMDLDALLALRPDLALVDDLHQVNAPGGRHGRRYQDVEELIAAGIDVYATLNVQYLESMADAVAQVTGIRVRETVADRILDAAADVQLVDLAPEELLRRLEQGKVHIPGHPGPAARKFFRPGNLYALREMALRRTAQWVDRQMQSYMSTHGISGPWPAGERVLVCVGPSLMSERLVRAGWRLAAGLDAEWISVYVETPAHQHLTDEQRDSLNHALRLTEDLGGKTVALAGLDVAEGIIHCARSHNVTQIVIGQPLRPRWRGVLQSSVVDRVIRGCIGTDVHVISSDPAQEGGHHQAGLRPGPHPWGRYAAVLALVAAITAFSGAVLGRQARTNVIMFYLLAVVISGLRWGLGPAVLASVLGALAFDFFFVPPELTLALANVEYGVTFIALLVVALVIGTLTGRLRNQVDLARRREAETASLYAFSRSMVSAGSAAEAAQSLVRHVSTSFARRAAVLLPGPGGLRPEVASPGYAMDPQELAAAAWTYGHGQPTGLGEATLPDVPSRCFPLRTPRGVIGVLAVRPEQGEGRLTPEQRRLVEAYAAQAAVVIERAQLEADARRAHLLAEADKLHTALLNSISHDLRTPLASIIGALTTVDDQQDRLDSNTQRDLVETAREEAERLNRLVSNLLDMTRLESGILRLAGDWCDVQDVLGMAINQMGNALAGRPVQVQTAPELPLVFVDYVLVVQVLKNLIENAMKHSPPDSPIDIDARAAEGMVQVRVSDRGSGVPPQQRERIFDRFYRVEEPGGPSGTGLGLAVCKGIVEAHRGRIWVEPRAGGGSTFAFTLPTQPATDEGGEPLGHQPE